MTFLVYLDEFGHIGPYVNRNYPKHNDSPVFGLAGYALPSDEVRGFGTWFFKRKCDLLKKEVEGSEKIPSQWEKKGSSLYTAKNVSRYRNLRLFTNRLFGKIASLNGFVFFVGRPKTAPPHIHNPNRLYIAVLLEAIKRINAYCAEDCDPASNFVLALDHHDRRSEMITAASQSMYGGPEPLRHLIEPPFHLESHRYQTIQAADWIAALVGRIGAIWQNPTEYPENQVFRTYFESRLNRVSCRSGINRPKWSQGRRVYAAGKPPDTGSRT